MAREIHFYTLFEAIYLQGQDKPSDLLASVLVETYEKLLGYLAKAKWYFGTRSLSTLSQSPCSAGTRKSLTTVLERFMKAPFEEDSVSTMMSIVGKLRDRMEQQARTLDRAHIDERLTSLSHGKLSYAYLTLRLILLL